jgi:mannosyltransferase
MNRVSGVHLAATCTVVLVAFSLRTVSLDSQSLWRDEVDALCYAYRFPSLAAEGLRAESAGSVETPCACPTVELAGEGDDGPSRLVSALSAMIRHNGPLYYFLLRGWVALAGVSAFGIRFLSLLFGVLSVPLGYALGRRLFGRRVAMLTALLMGVSPYQVYYSQEVKMYALVVAQALLAVYALRRACEGGGPWWWLVQIVCTSLALYCHVFAALLVPVQIALYLLWWPLGRGQYRWALLSLAILVLPYLPLLAWQAPAALQVRETGFPARSLAEMGEVLVNGWSQGISVRGWPWGTVLMGWLAGWGLLCPALARASACVDVRVARPWRERLALVCWLLLPLLGVWLVSLRQPLFTDRYLIWSAPAFYLLVSLGLISIWRLRSRHPDGTSVPVGRPAGVALLCIVLLIAAVNLRAQASEPIKADFRSAAAYVGERIESDELLLFQIPHSRYVFDYYFQGEEHSWADGLYTNHRSDNGEYLLTEQEAFWRVRAMLRGCEGVWLVLSEESMWDERALVRRWLEANSVLLDEAQFVRVGVYHFSGFDWTLES